MKDICNDKRNINIAYIGGGSRGWAWSFMMDLAMEEQMNGTVRLYDIDQEAAKKNQIIGTRISKHKEAKVDWKYEHAKTLDQALKGADFVVISILPGTFAEMYSDVHEPEKYRIYQSVGDTTGPGGILRALRTVPMFAYIADAIKKYCPDAWVINYTNPMSVCVRTLYEVFPDIKAFGCCHEVFGTQKLLAAMLDDSYGMKGIRRQDINVNVLGINHFTWFDAASYAGMDLMPVYSEFADKYYETGFLKGQDNNWMNDSFSCSHLVKFDLFRRFGLIAAAGDRHLAEFMPPWYLKDPDTVNRWKFGLTHVDWRIKDLEKKLLRSERLVSGQENFDLSESGEEGIALIKALAGLGQIVTNVNIPNQGQIPNLPLSAVVETNALFRRDSISPIMAGKIPGSLHPLISRHVDNQENILQAALHCDYKLALAVFLNDPLVTLDPNRGEELFKAMLYNTRKYLPAAWSYTA